MTLVCILFTRCWVIELNVYLKFSCLLFKAIWWIYLRVTIIKLHFCDCGNLYNQTSSRSSTSERELSWVRQGFSMELKGTLDLPWNWLEFGMQIECNWRSKFWCWMELVKNLDVNWNCRSELELRVILEGFLLHRL